MKTTNSLLWDKIVSYSIPFFIIIAQYKIIGYVNYGIVLLLLLFILIFLASNKREYLIYKNLFNFYFIIIIIFMVEMFRFGSFMAESIHWFLQAAAILFIIMVLSKYSKLELIYNSYVILGYISIAILLGQAVFIYGMGHEVAPISILPIAESDIRLWQIAPRPSALFTEPQAYCSFILPLLFLADKYKNKKLSILVCISILLSGSSFGILTLFFYFLYKSFSLENKILNKILIIFIGIISLLIMLNLSIFDSAVDKILKIDLTYDIRLTKGFIVYFDLPVLDKLIGLNGDVSTFILSNINDYSWAYRYLNDKSIHLLNYVTTFSSVFIKYGLISGVIFSFCIFNLFINSCSFAKAMAFLIIVTTFTATILFNSWFLFYYLLYFSRYKYMNNSAFYHLKFKVS